MRRLVFFIIGLALILLGAYGLLVQSPWSNTINTIFIAIGMIINLTQLFFQLPITKHDTEIPPITRSYRDGGGQSSIHVMERQQPSVIPPSSLQNVSPPTSSLAAQKLKVFLTLDENVYSIRGLKMSAGGQTLVSLGGLAIKEWNLSTGVAERTISSSTDDNIDISSDGKILVVADRDHWAAGVKGKITVWSLLTGLEIRIIKDRHFSHVLRVVVSPDGQTMVSGDKIGGQINVWNLSTGRHVRTIKGLGSVECMAISSDRQTLGSVSVLNDGTINIWNLSTGRHMRTLSTQSVNGGRWDISSIVISADGQTLVSGDWLGRVTIWNLPTGREIRTLPAQKGTLNNSVSSVAVSANGQIVTCGRRNGTVTIWDVPSGKDMQTLTGHKGDVSVAISANGQTLACSGSEDRMIKVWKA